VYFAGSLQPEKTPVRIANVDPDVDYELILTHQGFPPAQRRLTPKDWDRGAAKLEMALEINLVPPRPKGR